MYSVYQEGIKEYILKDQGYEMFICWGGALEMADRDGLAVIGYCTVYKIFSFVACMSSFFGFSAELEPDGRSIKCEDRVGNQVYLNKGGWRDRYYLNKWQLEVPINDQRSLCGLLTFLGDPLRFIEMNATNIGALDDASIREFLWGLKKSIKALDHEYIKFMLLKELDLVGDVCRMVCEAFINFFINMIKIEASD